MSEIQASHMTMFTVMAEIVSSAFGKADKQKPSPIAREDITEDLTQLDPQQYVSRVTQLFSGV